MLSLLYKLQRKPERVRRKIAFVASAVITGIIALIWLTSLRVFVDAPPVAAAKDKDESGPLRAFAENLSTFFSDASEVAQAALSAFSDASPDVTEPDTKLETAATSKVQKGALESGAD